MAGNSSKGELSQGNLYLGRNQSLKQKEQNLKYCSPGFVGQQECVALSLSLK